MAVSLEQLAIALRLTTGGEPAGPMADVLTRLLAVANARVQDTAPNAPDDTKDLAVIVYVGYLYDQPTSGRGDFYARAWKNSGAMSILSRYVERRAALRSDEPTPDVPIPSEGGLDREQVQALIDATVAGLNIPDPYVLPAAAVGVRGGVEAVSNDLIDAGSSQKVFGWMIGHVERMIRKVVPSWALKSTPPASEGGVDSDEVNGLIDTAFTNGLQAWARSAPSNQDAEGNQIYPPADALADAAVNGHVLQAFNNGHTRWAPTASVGTDQTARDAAKAAQAAADKNLESVDSLRRKTNDIHVLRDRVTYQDYSQADALFTWYAPGSAVGQELLNKNTYDAAANAGSVVWRFSGTVPADNLVVVRVMHTLDAFDFAFSFGAGRPLDVEDARLVGSDATWQYFFLAQNGPGNQLSKMQTREHDVHGRWEGELGGPQRETIDGYPLFSTLSLSPAGLPAETFPDAIELFIGDRIRPGTISKVAVSIAGFVTPTLDDSGGKDGLTQLQNGGAVLRWTLTADQKTTLENNISPGDAPLNFDVTFTLSDGSTARHRIRFPVHDDAFAAPAGGGGAPAFLGSANVDVKTQGTLAGSGINCPAAAKWLLIELQYFGQPTPVMWIDAAAFRALTVQTAGTAINTGQSVSLFNPGFQEDLAPRLARGAGNELLYTNRGDFASTRDPMPLRAWTI